MIDLLARAIRLARSNPRLFLNRLGLAARSPRRYIRARRFAIAEYAAIQSSYDAWRAAPRNPSVPDRGPLLSVLIPVRNTDPGMLNEAIDAVVSQTYGNWELCVADDASDRSETIRVLERWSGDPRILMTRRDSAGHISAASNDALELASGEFVVLLDHDDLLAPHALARVAESAGIGGVDFMYSDEDKLDPSGRHIEPFFKPAWSPTLLTSCNYVTHLAALRRSSVIEAGGFRNQMVGSQDHDLFLRIVERARRVAHIPDILYSWRQAPGSTARASIAKPYAIGAARLAIEEAVTRRGIAGRVERTALNGIHVVRRELPETVRICLMSGAGSPAARSLRDHRSVVLAGRRDADYLIWLAADARPRTRDWLAALLEPLLDLSVAFSGGETVTPRDVVLQAGMIVRDGEIAPAFSGIPNLPHSNFYLNLKDLPHEVGAVHPSVCAIRRDTFEELGGLQADYSPVAAIADLCVTAWEQDYRAVYVPGARMTVETDFIPSETPPASWQWGSFCDPYWNPNLSLSRDGLPFAPGRWTARALPAASAAPVAG